MKIFKRVLIFFLVILFFFVFKELVSLYVLLNSFNEYLAYVVFLLIALFIIYYGILPIFKIINIPVYFSPTKNKTEVNKILKKRIELLRKNQELINSNFDTANLNESREDYDKAIAVLNEKVVLIRKRYISQLFYSTTIAQNGFLDAILIFSSSVNLIKEIFTVYHGRTNFTDLLKIGKHVYYSIAIGGSESVEYASDEIFTSLTSDTLKSIPFIDKIIGSVADGFINALMLSRIAIITQNYCTKIYIEREKDLYPKYKVIYSTTKEITSDIINKLKSVLKTMSKDKVADLSNSFINPIKYLMDKALLMSPAKEENISKIKNGINNINPLNLFSPISKIIGINKVTGFIKRKKLK